MMIRNAGRDSDSFFPGISASEPIASYILAGKKLFCVCVRLHFSLPYFVIGDSTKGLSYLGGFPSEYLP